MTDNILEFPGRGFVSTGEAAAVSADCDLAATERKIAELRANRGDDDSSALLALADKIHATPPRSLADAAVKLRLLCDAEIGMPAGESEAELGSLAQVRQFVEQTVAAAADGAILSLFHQWQAAERETEAMRAPSDAQIEANSEVICRLERRLYDASVAGPVGLAIKAYLIALKGVEGIAPVYPDPLILDVHPGRAVRFGPDGLQLDLHAVRGLLASAAAFLPELAPYVAAIVELPLRKPGAPSC